MKRGTPDHWKMQDLARFAEVPVAYGLPWANGIMERIWHFAAQYAPAGDIGRIPNRAIARLCGWPETDAEKLVNALVESKWLDRSDICGLMIHDWREHCEDSVHSKLARNLQYFADGKAPKITGLRKDEAEKAKVFYDRNPVATNLNPVATPLQLISTPLQPSTTPLQLISTPLQPSTTPAQPRCNDFQPIAHALAVALAVAGANAQPPAPDGADPIPIRGDDWFEEVYRRHPRKGDRGLAMTTFMETVQSHSFNAEEFDRSHREWCVYWEANQGHKFGPKLAEWLVDQGWKYPPPRASPADVISAKSKGTLLQESWGNIE